MVIWLAVKCVRYDGLSFGVEHQTEPRSHPRFLGFEGVIGYGPKVEVFSCESVNKVEIADFCVFNVDAERVCAVFSSLEADRYLVGSLGTCHSIVLTVLRDKEFGAAVAYGIFLKAFIRVKVDSDFVENRVGLGLRHRKGKGRR